MFSPCIHSKYTGLTESLTLLAVCIDMHLYVYLHIHEQTHIMHIFMYVCIYIKNNLSFSFCSLSETGQLLTTLTSSQTAVLRENIPDRYYSFRSEINFNIYLQIHLDDRCTVLSMYNNWELGPPTGSGSPLEKQTSESLGRCSSPPP